MPRKKLDAEPLLKELAQIRRSIPFLDHDAPPVPRREDKLYAECTTAEDFEYAAVAEAAQSLADELHAAIESRRALALEKALEIYWAAEELSHDPAHAHLIEHVEKMRAAYIAENGVPPPPKPVK